MSAPHKLTTILPCNDLDASEAFYAKLGFARQAAYDGYRILADGHGADSPILSAPQNPGSVSVSLFSS